MIRVLIILFLLTGCSQNQVRTHIGTGAGAVTGFTTCRALLDSGLELTAACKTSHTNWGNAATGNWGSIKISRTYVNKMKKCREYTSVISIKHQWPMNGIKRESEWGIACQMPDGRWIIEETA